MNRVVTAGRLLLGATMTGLGANHFLRIFPMPTLADPLARRMVEAFAHSGLLSVALAICLGGGLLLLARRAVPFALAAMMPVCTCAAYIALVLEGAPLLALPVLAIFALNGLLMLGHFDSYRAMLAPHPLALGETREANFRDTYANPLKPLPLGQLPAALAVLLAAFAVYHWIVPFGFGDMGELVLLFPAAMLALGTVRSLVRNGQSKKAGEKAAS